MNLATTTSIVDFLKSKGQDSSFEARKKRFDELGLNQSLGDFRGSDVQNIQMLKTLSAPPAGALPVPEVPASPAKTILDDATNAANVAAPVNPQFKNVIPPKAEPSFQDILSAVRGQTTTQLEEESARLAKEKIAGEAGTAKAKVRQSAAERGVAFSPAFFEQPQQEIDAKKVAADLGVDIGIAKIIARGMESELAQRAKQTAAEQKAAEAEQKAQATFLEKTQGVAVDPLTGEAVKTLATQRAEEADLLKRQAAARIAATSAETRARVAARFTPTQLNAGSANARMTLDQFKQLDPETQNRFVQGGKNFTDDQLRKAIQDNIAKGEDRETIISKLKANDKIVNLDRALEIAEEQAPTKTTFRRAIDYIKGFFD